MRELEKKEIEYFYRNRELFFEGYSLAINLYRLGEVYVYQDFIDNSFKELVFDNLDEIIDVALRRIKGYDFDRRKPTSTIILRKEIRKRDIAELSRIKETKDLIIQDKFIRPMLNSEFKNFLKL